LLIIKLKKMHTIKLFYDRSIEKIWEQDKLFPTWKFSYGRNRQRFCRIRRVVEVHFGNLPQNLSRDQLYKLCSGADFYADDRHQFSNSENLVKSWSNGGEGPPGLYPFRLFNLGKNFPRTEFSEKSRITGLRIFRHDCPKGWKLDSNNNKIYTDQLNSGHTIITMPEEQLFALFEKIKPNNPQRDDRTSFEYSFWYIDQYEVESQGAHEQKIPYRCDVGLKSGVIPYRINSCPGEQNYNIFENILPNTPLPADSYTMIKLRQRQTSTWIRTENFESNSSRSYSTFCQPGCNNNCDAATPCRNYNLNLCRNQSSSNPNNYNR